MHTINKDKDDGFVNGMEAGFVRREGLGLTVVHDQAAEFTVYPVTDKRYRSYYTMHLTYALF